MYRSQRSDFGTLGRQGEDYSFTARGTALGRERRFKPEPCC